MKKMISNIKSLAALLMAGAAFTACSNSDDIIEQPVQPTEPQVYTLVIQASKGSDATTRSLDADVNFTWDGTETFDVLQYSESEEKDVIIGTAKADYSGTSTTTITATLTQAPSEDEDIDFFLHGAILDWTGQVGLLTGTAGNSISEKYDYATDALNRGNFTVDGNEIKTSSTLDFDAIQSIVKFTLVDKGNNDAAISATRLNIHSSEADGLVQIANYINLDAAYGDLTITPTNPTSVIYAAMYFEKGDITLTASDGSNVYSYTKSDPSFAPGNYYDITVKMKKVQAITSSNATAVLASGCKTLTDDEAATIAKECWNVAGGTVYVVSSIETTPSTEINYIYTTDGITMNTGTANSEAELAALYGDGCTAWYIEPSASSAPTVRALSEVTSGDVGKIAGADGNIYDTKDAATTAGTTPVAMIAYVGTLANICIHGLAIALEDESNTMNWSTAKSTCEGKTAVYGGTWRLPSTDDWQYMFIGCGNTNTYVHSGSLVSEMTFGCDSFKSKLSTAEGTALQESNYWSSTEHTVGYYAWYLNFQGDTAKIKPYSEDGINYYVRACLAF